MILNNKTDISFSSNKIIKLFFLTIFLFFLNLSIYPEDSEEVLLYKAKNYVNNGYYDNAIKQLDILIENNPVLSEALYYRAKAYEFLDNDLSAIEDYKKAIELNSKYNSILYEEGKYHYSKAKYDRALVYFINDIIINESNKLVIIKRLKKNEVFTFYQKYKIKITGNTKKIKLVCTIPSSYENRQKIYNFKYSIEPDKEFEDNESKYAEFTFDNPKNEINIQIASDMQIFPYSFKIASKLNNKKEYDNQMLSRYLIHEKFLEKDNPSIQKVARKIKGNTEEETVRNTYNFVLKHLRYKFANSRDNGAVYALKKRGNDCSEYSDLFVALCRANNIPSRKISGYILKDGNISWGHAWAETYFSKYGWIPFDPTFDDTDGKRNTTTFDTLRNVYIYKNFKRSDENLEGHRNFFYKFWGDNVEFYYNTIIEYLPKDEYLYFYKIITALKCQNIDLFLKYLEELNAKKAEFKDKKWEYNIAEYFSDKIAEDDFIKIAEEMKKLCEAYCFIAYNALFRNNYSKAKFYFKKSVGTNSVNDFEYLLSYSELRNFK